MVSFTAYSFIQLLKRLFALGIVVMVHFSPFITFLIMQQLISAANKCCCLSTLIQYSLIRGIETIDAISLYLLQGASLLLCASVNVFHKCLLTF